MGSELRRSLLPALLFTLALIASTLADKRVALVIGNFAYDANPTREADVDFQMVDISRAEPNAGLGDSPQRFELAMHASEAFANRRTTTEIAEEHNHDLIGYLAGTAWPYKDRGVPYLLWHHIIGQHA